MVASVLVGAGRITLSLDDSRYTPAAIRAVGASARLQDSWKGAAVQGVQFGGVVGDVTRSMRSSLIATAAYALGVNVVRTALSGSVRNFLEFDSGLIAVQKTAGLTNEQMTALGDTFERITTQQSVLGRALPVTVGQLLKIAEVVGQANITEGIPEISEAIALLELTSTDLLGERAAEAVSRLIKNTTTLETEALSVVSTITALGNVFVGGEAALIEQALSLTRALSQFDLSAQEILAMAAVLEQAGARSEKSATVLQRTIIALSTAANEYAQGDISRLSEIAAAAGRNVDDLFQTIQRGDFAQGIRAFAEAIAALPTIGTDQTRTGLLQLFFGGEQAPPARITEIQGLLAANVDELERAFDVAAREFERPTAVLIEAERAAESYQNRIVALRNEWRDFGRDVGGVAVRTLIPLGEQIEGIQAGVGGLGAALLTGAVIRGFARVSSTAKAAEQVIQIEQRKTFSERVAQLGRIQTIEARLAQTRARLAGIPLGGYREFGSPADGRPALARGTQRELNKLREQERTTLVSLGNAKRRDEGLSQRLTQQNARLTRTATRHGRALSVLRRGYFALGGPVGLAIGGFVALSVIMANTTSDAEEMEDQLERLRSQFGQLKAAQEDLTPAGRAELTTASFFREQSERVIALREELEEVRSNLIYPEGSTARTDQLERQIAAAEAALREAQGFALNLGGSAGPARSEVEAVARRTQAQLEAVDITISSAAENAKQFADRLGDANREAAEQAQLEVEIAELSERDQRIRRLIFDEQQQITRQRLETATEILAVEDRLTQARAGEAAAQAQVDAAVGSSQQRREEFEKNARSAATQRAKLEAELLELQRQQTAEFGLQIDRQGILVRAAAEERAARVREIQGADISSAREGAGDTVARIRQRVETTRAEAENDLRLATLDSGEARLERLRQELFNRIEIERDNLERQLDTARQEARQRGIEVTSETLEATAALREFNLQVETGAVDLAEDLEATAAAMERLNDPLHQLSLEVADVGGELRETAARGLGAFAEELLSLTTDGKFDFKELATSIIQDLIRIQIRAVIVGNLLRAFFPDLAGGHAAGSQGVGSAGFAPGSYHSGGVPALGEGQPHSGSLKSDEVFAVLRKKEEILTEYDPRHRFNFFSSSRAAQAAFVANLPRFHRGGVAGGAAAGGAEPSMRIELINESGTPLRAVDGGERIDFDGLVRSVFLRDAGSNGPMTQIIKALSGR